MLVKDQKWGKSSRRSMKILTIIVTYNGMRWAQRCLQSLRDSEVHTDIYVIDNGSTDGTQAFIREHFPEAELLLQVHDELIVECPEEMAPQVAELVSREMEQVASLSVPLTAEAKFGKSWYEAK